MAGRHGVKYSPNTKARHGGVVMSGAVGALVAAAAMATGSAAPAKADFEDLLDPIIQPLLTSLTDSLTAVDPAAATDVTSWTDSLLANLNSIDLAVPSAAEPALAVGAASNDPTTGTYDIPITVQEGTEPTVQATVDGADTTLLVDTGSSGLVIPYTDLGSNFLTQLESLFELGLPTGIGASGFTGGVDYVYLTYDNVPVDYGMGALNTTNTPVDVEIFSYPTSFSSPSDFQTFLADDHSTGILGIGDSAADAGPTVSPLQALGYEGVTVDIPKGDLIVSPTNPGTAIDTLNGAPIVTKDLTETVTTSTGTLVGTGSVSDDIDSGGVYGTIPSAIASSVAQGDNISVYDGNTLLYSYTVGTGEAPLVTSGSGIDSGVEPFFTHPVYIDYANDTIAIDKPQ